MRKSIPALAIAASALLTGCGTATDVFGPSSTDAGVTIRGTVVDGGVAATSDVVAFSGSSGIRVSVAGTGIATTTDSSGEFVLEGVPAGTVTLEFEVDGDLARLEISGLLAGQEIQITVSVAGHDVTLVDVDGEEVEVSGVVESLDPFQVSGQVFEVTEDTVVRRHGEEVPFEELLVGDLVEVKGVRMPDGSVLALRIQIEDSGNDDGDDDHHSDDDSDDDSDHEDSDHEDSDSDSHSGSDFQG